MSMPGGCCMTVTNITSINFGEKNWRCRNEKNSNDKYYNFFKQFDDDIIDERNLKIKRQKKKKFKDEECDNCV